MQCITETLFMVSICMVTLVYYSLELTFTALRGSPPPPESEDTFFEILHPYQHQLNSNTTYCIIFI